MAGNRLMDRANPLTGGNRLTGETAPTLADAWSYNAKAIRDYVARQQAEAERAGLVDPATGWPTQAGITDAARQFSGAMLMGTTAPGIRAFHGSPHSFDRFDMSKIGTGEGAQAYGHGLYFAEKEGIARGYRERLSRGGVQITRDGEAIGEIPGTQTLNDPQWVESYRSLMPAAEVPGWIKSGVLRDIRGLGEKGQAVDLEAARQATVARMTKEMARLSPEAAQRAIGDIHKAYDSIGGEVQFRAPGHMYEAKINADPAHMLEWDAPRDQLAPKVREWAKTAYPGAWENAADGSSLYQQIVKQAQSEYPGATKGYMPPAGWNAAANVSEEMRQAGIPGIRYADAGSRRAEGGTSNYVVFDDNLVSILRKYGVAGLTAAGIAHPFGGDARPEQGDTFQ